MKTNHLHNIVALATLLLWSAVPPSRAATNLVRIGNYWFDPTNITISVGDTVRWSNTVVTAHDTTSETGIWASPTFASPNSYSFKFTNAGYYPYICAVHIVSHPEQTGTVTVVSGALPPTVSITSPADGQDFSIPATFTITANAAGVNGAVVTNVQFFTNATLHGADSTNPYSIVASNLASGNYTLTAKATDNSGLSTTSSAVRIAVGTSRLVKMGNYWFAPTNLTVNAGDTVVWTNTTVTGHDTTANSGLWASPTISGTTTYSFRLTNAGYYPYICAVHITAQPEQTGTVSVVSVANVPPAVAITNPPNGVVLTAPASLTLAASASDSNGTVSQVEFFNGASSLGIDLTSPYSVAVSSLGAGNYTFSAVATDNNGAKATNSINLTVNASPTVSLSSPTNGTSCAAPANITLSATANDSDGSVTNVEFFNGATKLGEDTTNPYSFAWNNVAAGNYTLTVKATDNRSATATSVAITISVTNSPPTPVTILSPAMYGSAFTFSFATQSGRSYSVQFTPTIQPANWQVLTNFTGNGSDAYITDANYGAAQRFYRVGAQ